MNSKQSHNYTKGTKLREIDETQILVLNLKYRYDFKKSILSNTAPSVFPLSILFGFPHLMLSLTSSECHGQAEVNQYKDIFPICDIYHCFMLCSLLPVRRNV